MRYFSAASVAARYTWGRPYFHPMIIQHIIPVLSLVLPVEHAIDVGCGTGLSTVALTAVARTVIGLDPSAAMLAYASHSPSITYCRAPAEYLPFADACCPLITVASAMHWVNQAAFLAEAKRVLTTSGWLVIYGNYFAKQPEATQDFERWNREIYLPRFPSPPRAKLLVEPVALQTFGFTLQLSEYYHHQLRFSIEGVADYLITQSNVIAAVEDGYEQLADIKAWLIEQLTPLFGNRSTIAFSFIAPIWCLQKTA